MELHKWLLQAYVRCPKQFWYFYTGREARQDVSAALGQQFHSLAHAFFDWVDKDKLKMLTSETETYDYFCQYLQFVSPEALKELVKTFLLWEAKDWVAIRDIQSWMPLHREARVNLKIQGRTWDLTVDRIDCLQDEYIVIEYKTFSYNLTSVRRETALYAFAAYKTGLIPKPATKWEVWCPGRKKRTGGYISNRTVKALKKWIVRLYEALDTEQFPPKQGDHCAWCPFVNLCIREHPELWEV